MSDDGNTLGNLISTVLGNKKNLINARSKVCNKIVADKNVDAWAALQKVSLRSLNLLATEQHKVMKNSAARRMLSRPPGIRAIK